MRSLTAAQARTAGSILRVRWATSDAKKGSETLSWTVTQGVIEKNAPGEPGKPKEVPKPTHPSRNMEVQAKVPNEETAKFVPEQVPNQPGGGKYPDPSNDERGAKMTSGPHKEATREQGARPGSELLGENVEGVVDNKKS